MSNFICPTCGFNNIDCGRDGYKTDREIELEKKLEIAIKALEFVVETIPADKWIDERDLESCYRKAEQALTKINE